MTTARPKKKRRWIWYALGVLVVSSGIEAALHPRGSSTDSAAPVASTAESQTPDTTATDTGTSAPATATAPVAPTAVTPAAPTSTTLGNAVLSYGRTPKKHENIDHSNEEGRQVYDFGTTSLGETRLVFYTPDEWWLEVKQPTFSIDDLVPADQRSGENGNGVATNALVDSGPLKGMSVNWIDNGSQVNVRTDVFMWKYMQ